MRRKLLVVDINPCVACKGARVEAGARVSMSIICDGAVVKSNALIPRGCILSYGTVVGAGVVLPEYTRVSLSRCLKTNSAKEKNTPRKRAGSSSSADNGPAMAVVTEPAYDTHILGADGKGYVWSCEGKCVYTHNYYSVGFSILALQ